MNHIPVLKNEVIETFEYLQTKAGVFVDGTLGLAGHSIEILQSHPKMKMIGLDQDQNALQQARKNIAGEGLEARFTLLHHNFKELKDILQELEISTIDGAMLDLGVSSLQLDDKSRGFSFQDPGQLLDMRMNQDQIMTARDVLNSYSKSDLTKILYEYGEEPFANKIVSGIMIYRKKKPIQRVDDLLKILQEALPKSLQLGRRQHYATKTFQALRIAVNDELGILTDSVEQFVDALSPKSRLAIITFHSLEDRIIKDAFRNLADPCHCPPKLPCVCGLVSSVKIVTKKPIVASADEIALNPRSRSAKLRIVEKL